MTAPPIRVRFAPSPTGHLHLGNVRTPLFNWLYARGRGGTFVLRLEDTDAGRSTDESVASVLEDLRWLGLTWDEGPEVGGARGPYRQTERYDLYRRTLDALAAEGKAYPCFCSQEELDAGREAARAAGRAYTYPGTCRRLSEGDRERLRGEGRTPVFRLAVPPQPVAFTDLVRGPVVIHGGQFGDWVLTRPDGSPTYNFAVVVDDAAMGITHVIRGEDHLSNTPKQIVLYEALGLTPPSFAHLSMILGTDGSKLSKRHGDVSLDAFRTRGFLPEAMVNGLALLGWSHPEEREILDAGELVRTFDLDRVNRSAAVFDEAKLRHINREHLKALDAGAVAAGIAPFLTSAGLLPGEPLEDAIQAWLASLAGLIRERMDVFSDAPLASLPVFDFGPEALQGEVLDSLREPAARSVVEAFLRRVESADMAAPGAFKEAVSAVRDELKVKGKALFHPIRLALTAEESGPALDALVPILEEGSRLALPRPVVSPAARLRAMLAHLDAGA